jgi:hypothetical protein
MTELGFGMGGSGDGYDGWTAGWTDGRTDEWTVGQDGGNEHDGVVEQQVQVRHVRRVGAGGHDRLPEHECCPQEAS